jgi:hypothetical protein
MQIAAAFVNGVSAERRLMKRINSQPDFHVAIRDSR